VRAYVVYDSPQLEVVVVDCNFLMEPIVRSFVLTLFIFKAPNYVLARTLTERVV